MAIAKRPVPEGFSTVTPQLTLDNAAQAIDWYKKGLGAQELSRSTGPDGKIMHAEIQIGNSRLMLNDAVMGGKGPKAIGGSPASLWIYVDDCDALFNKAVSAGAKATMPVDNQFWGGWMGVLVDPEVDQWRMAAHKEDLTKQELDQRAAEFYKKMSPKAATHS